MARPTKYCPERAKKVIAGLRDGMTIDAACAYGGTSDTSLQRWMERYEGFGEQVKEALREAEARYTQVIAKAAFGQPVEKKTVVTKANGDIEEKVESYIEYDWQAARYWLSKRRRTDWGEEEEKSAPPVNQFFMSLPPDLISAIASKARTLSAEYQEIDPPGD